MVRASTRSIGTIPGSVLRGFELDLLALITPDQDDFDPMMFHRQHLMRRGTIDETPPEMLRFGIRFLTDQQSRTPEALITILGAPTRP